jgi:FMN reductase
MTETLLEHDLSPHAPVVVGIGGTVRPTSSSERSLRVSLAAAEAAGAGTILFSGAALANLPMYNPEAPDIGPEAMALIEAVRGAEGIIIASPGYHGTLSGLVKNALDYLEELRTDTRPYLDGRAVGLIATAMGWQAAVNTLTALRAVTHSLRGWPTPLGAAINSAQPCFDSEGNVIDTRVEEQLALVGQQVVAFARSHLVHPA